MLMSDLSPASITVDLPVALERFFGFSSFQPGQREVIEDVMAGRPTVAVMPTGAGKSLCYQLPALLFEGLTIVVSPLIALMKDQVDALTSRGISAAFINSSQSPEAQREVLDQTKRGEIRLLYVAPERFRSANFMSRLADQEVALMAIDEAHCISRWGHDFRPDYGRLGQVVARLRPSRLLACTATATPEVRADIERTLDLESPAIHVAGFLRTNLHLSAKLCRKDSERESLLISFIESYAGQEGAIIVYGSTRRRVERFAQSCAARFGQEAVVSYHAGLSDEDRSRAQDLFMGGEARIVVATNAFGMGIDRHDIRGVVHIDLPRTVEGYYQEVGRAGRDGLPARCLMLFNPIDRRTHEFLIDLSHPEPRWVEAVWDTLSQARFEGLSCAEIAKRADIKLTEPQVESALRALSRVGAAESDMERYWYGHPKAPDTVNQLGVDHGEITQRRQRELLKLDELCAFAYAFECRHAQVLGYFGESFDIDNCPGCDRCDNPEDTQPLDDETLLIVRKALAGVARAEGRFGLRKVAGMLAGSRSRDITSTTLGSLTTYGLLSSLGQSRCVELLQALTDRGFCQMTGGRYPMLSVSRSGWEVMQGRRDPVGLNFAAKGSTRPTEGRRSGRGQAPQGECPWEDGLRTFRTEEAAKRQVPPYVVFSNRTLSELAEQRPRDREAFLEIHGLGPGRWDTYGERLINTIEQLAVQIDS